MGDVLGVLQVVSDLDQRVAFFTHVLEFEEIQRFECKGACWEELFQLPASSGILVELRLGNETLYLMQFLPGQGAPYPKNSRSDDLWFQHIAIVVSDMQKAHTKLMKHGVQSISDFHQTIPQSNATAAGIKAFYFRSPDGHPLELISFPPHKGNPRWQSKSSLFLGIDHTAIVISNTEKSLPFYQDLFGMRVVGGSLNYGEEQEKLSGVLEAKVKITSLCFFGSEGMGIEFLEYLHPIGGRKKAKETRAHHLTETQTVIAIDNISFGRQAISLEGGAWNKGLMIRDPDGHRVLVVEKKKNNYANKI